MNDRLWCSDIRFKSQIICQLHKHDSLPCFHGQGFIGDGVELLETKKENPSEILCSTNPEDKDDLADTSRQRSRSLALRATTLEDHKFALCANGSGRQVVGIGTWQSPISIQAISVAENHSEMADGTSA